MNAIAFVLRGCPAAALGAYGNEWVSTPDLDRVAAEGTVFDRHLSDNPEAAAARRAWRTGRHQAPPLPGRAPPAAPPAPDLFYELRAAGVRAILVRANHPETDVPGFDAGWAEVIDARPQADDDSPLDELLRLFPALLDRLAAVPRWLVWVEIDRLLPPWEVSQDVFDVYFADDEDDPRVEGEAREEEEEDEEDEDDPEGAVGEAEGEAQEPAPDEGKAEDGEPAPPPAPVEPVRPWADPAVGAFDRADLDAWKWLHCSFAAAVTDLDTELGCAFAHLRERPQGEAAAWVVTSDLGWPLGEHGQLGPHRPWLHEEFVHVPLILRRPHAAGGGRRVEALTQPADLMPTLRELCGLAAAADPSVQGQSLLSLADGKVTSVRPFAVSGMALGPAAEWAIRTPEAAYLLPAVPHPDDPPRPPMLFAKPDDRHEVNDVRQHHVELAERLEEELRRTMTAG